jgi:hypothetical protein
LSGDAAQHKESKVVGEIVGYGKETICVLSYQFMRLFWFEFSEADFILFGGIYYSLKE